MPVKKKTRKKKITSSAKRGRKPVSARRIASKKTAAKPRSAGAASKSRKRKIVARPVKSVQPETPSSRARGIVITATKVALTTRTRAKRWLQKAGEYLSKPGRRLAAMKNEIPDKAKSPRKQSKLKKPNR